MRIKHLAFFLLAILMLCLAASGTAEAIPMPERDYELYRADQLGLIPEDWKTDWNGKVWFQEYCDMLQRMIEIWMPEKVPEWEELSAAARNQRQYMKRQHGILCLAEAEVLLGRQNWHYITVGDDIEISDEEWDKNTKDMIWNYPYFPNWGDKVIDHFGTEMDYAWGGAVRYSLHMSRFSGLPIFPYDHEAQSMHLRDFLTRDEAVRSVLRMLESDPAVLLPDSEYVDLADAGTYDPSIITAELLAKPSNLPEASTQHLPASWSGGCIDKMYPIEYLPYNETVIRFLSENGFNFARLYLGFDTLRYPDMPKDPRLVNMNELRQLDQLIAWGMKYDVHIQISSNRLLDKDGNQTSTHLRDENGQEIPAVGTSNQSMPIQASAWNLSREYWVMLAKRYADIPAKNLSFDLLNEQQAEKKDQLQLAKKHFPGLVQAVREINPDRPLIISFESNPNMEWIEFTASQGVALGYHPYHPAVLTSSNRTRVEMLPYLKAIWPQPWLPGGLLRAGKGAITLTGAIGGTQLSVHVQSASKEAALSISADGERLGRFPLSKLLTYNKLLKEYGMYDNLVTVDIPENAQSVEVKFAKAGAGGIIDTMLLTGPFGTINIQTHDSNGHPDNSKALPIVVHADGTLSNTENTFVDAEYIYEHKIKPVHDIAKKYGVGFMCNEFGAFSIGYKWDIETIAQYHEDMIAMFNEKEIGWCNGEMYNYVPRSLIFQYPRQPQWIGTEVIVQEYEYEDYTDRLLIDKHLLDAHTKLLKK